jgi:thioester reductase-like protein
MRPTLFITGATGFLGAATLAHFLRTVPDARVIAMVRASSIEAARARLSRSLARFEEPSLAPLTTDSVEIVLGDLVDAASLDQGVISAVTHVLHAAADTSFRSVRNVRRVNILGALALAHRMRRAPHLVRYVHVGTAFSCGVANAACAVLDEDDYPHPDARHAVEYTNAKAEAEMLLAATAQDLPIVIARPSIIIGHSRLGCGPSGSIFWVYRAMDLLRRLTTSLDVREDIVPVDFAATALTTLLFKDNLAHQRYHVSAGEGASCAWREISPAFDRHHGARPEDPWLKLSIDEILGERHRFAPRFGLGDEERLMMALGLYYRFPSVVFANARLLAEGVHPPPRFVDYLDACMANPAGRSVYDQMRDDD